MISLCISSCENISDGDHLGHIRWIVGEVGDIHHLHLETLAALYVVSHQYYTCFLLLRTSTPYYVHTYLRPKRRGGIKKRVDAQAREQVHPFYSGRQTYIPTLHNPKYTYSSMHEIYC